MLVLSSNSKVLKMIEIKAELWSCYLIPMGKKGGTAGKSAASCCWRTRFERKALITVLPIMLFRVMEPGKERAPVQYVHSVRLRVMFHGGVPVVSDPSS